MQEKFFSIIVVSLNPGEKLQKTLNSIVGQSFQDYEVILKDGGSSDYSLEALEKEGFFTANPQIRVVRERDSSIYEGMNQAVKQARGSYLQFLNCGDLFYDDTVLKQVAAFIRGREEMPLHHKDGHSARQTMAESRRMSIYYGNQYNCLQKSVVYSAPVINDFTCYRNVPCHQVCFYSRDLFKKRAYNSSYRVRADYEHFLYCIYEEKAKACSMPVLVVSYEGGGFSETKENRRKSAREHKEITRKYLGKQKVLSYQLLLWLSLAPLRTKMAESPAFSGIYNGLKRGIYGWLRRG